MILSSEFNNTQSFNVYRRYARLQISTLFKGFWRFSDFSIDIRNLWKFLGELNTEFNQFNLNELIEDFLGLEDNFFHCRNNHDFIPLYHSIRNQLEHSKRQQLADNDELWKNFHATLISKHNTNIKRNKQNTMC